MFSTFSAFTIFHLTERESFHLLLYSANATTAADEPGQHTYQVCVKGTNYLNRHLLPLKAHITRKQESGETGT